MHLLVVGLNHNTASIEVRERAALADKVLASALTILKKEIISIREAVILSTCNRTEIYCLSTKEVPDNKVILQWFAQYQGLKRDDFLSHSYTYLDDLAVQHLFHVASGLDSMVLGEPQILGQIKSAYQKAHLYQATGKILNRLFQRSFSVAKKVRTKTEIGKNSVSVSFVGVALIKNVFASLVDKKALLIGAGETIELVARYLHQAGLKKMVIANRSKDNAEKWSKQYDGQVIPLSDIPQHLSKVDIVISSTASTLPLLDKEMVESALKKRKYQSMCILDLAVPRDIDPSVSELKNVYLHTIDSLKEICKKNQILRVKEKASAQYIIDQEVVVFMDWLRSVSTDQIIALLRSKTEGIAQEQIKLSLEKWRRGDSPEDVLTGLSNNIIHKILHKPSSTLKKSTPNEKMTLLSATQRLFRL